MEKFCSILYLAGLNECYQSKNKITKFIWIILYATGFAITGYFMFEIINDFNKNPTVTKIYYDSERELVYPKIYLIVGKDLSEYWRNSNVSNNAVNYFTSLTNFICQLGDGSIFIDDENFTANYETAKTEALEYAKRSNLTNLNAVFRSAFKDLFDFVKINCVLSCNYSFDLQKSSYYADYFDPPVYSIKFELDFKNISTDLVTKMLAIPSAGPLLIKSVDNERDPFETFTFFIAVSFSSVRFDPDSIGYETQLKPNTKYTFRIKPRVVKRYHIGRACRHYLSDELPNKFVDYFTCVMQCNMLTTQKLHNCQPFNNASANLIVSTNETPFCSHLMFTDNDYDKCNDDNIVVVSRKDERMCYDQCLPMCEETIYETTAFGKTSATSVNKTFTSAIFTFADVYGGIMTVEDVPSFTFQSAVSNVGGQLGLWLGLSVITAFQAVLFWINYLLDRNCLNHRKHHVHTISK